MTTFPKRAILPCEIKSREFESKLLLACCLAEQGWTSNVGSRNDIHMQLSHYPQSIYLGKDVRFSSKKILTLLQLLGHPFVAMDEEALIYLSREKYRDARVDPRMLKAAKALFAWGPDNALAWTESSAYSGAPIVNTGNGRIDLLRPELRSVHAAKQKQLETTYGPFVLINTNFGSINHYLNNLSVKPGETLATPAPPQGYFAHRLRVYDAFVKLIPELATQFPNLNFILRPHPSENHDAWRKAMAGFANCKVISEGNVVPWVLASKAVIHNGCTTGIEAYLLDKPAIAYMPYQSEEFDIHLPNELSLKVETESELLAVLKKFETGRKAVELRTAEREAILQQHIASATGLLASDHIAVALEAIRANSSTAFLNRLTWPIGAIATAIRSAIKQFHKNRPGHKSNIAYTRHRFPETSVIEVQQLVANFTSCLGRFEDVEVREIKAGLIFEISMTRNEVSRKSLL